ncbi:hypothetical protein [Aeromonas sp.]|uniref:hypothetical protein n=1 Tax=Aeromonas sp. TaxID=647 RepID=UPI00258C6A0C|nr:hypothetical protein [Aeromonas sp.]MCX7128048.1 hypothetical protein [Aeromonas sp.]
MPFSDMMTDTVDVLKADGAKHTDIPSIVDSHTITIMSPTFIVEHGDLVMRRMSNGGEETYKVLDPVFTEQFHDIPACYSLKVKKLGIPEAKAAVQHITYNFNGHNARVNNSSVDNSVNTVQIDNRAQTYINELREALKAAPLSASGREEALEVADAIEAQFESGKPKRSVISALLAGLPALESIVAITTGIASLVP